LPRHKRQEARRGSLGVRNALALVLLTTSLALTGCTQGDPGDDFGDPTCPSWTRGQSRQIINGNLAVTNRTTVPDLERWDFTEPGDKGSGLGTPYPDFQGKPLDFITIDLHQRQSSDPNQERLLYIQDAELHVEFFAERDGQLGEDMEAYEEGKPATAKHEWVFRTAPGGYLIENLTWKVDLAASDQQPDPHGVFVRWTMVPNLDNDIDTASVVIMRYSPEFWYRTCWADGTRV
jgi:hypothetical protein